MSSACRRLSVGRLTDKTWEERVQSFDLDRFVLAQRDVYSTALNELLAGSKRSHWMWFIFPQIKGLGRSDIARFYALSGRDEAQAYLDHVVLGPRLAECTQAMLRHSGRSATTILGSPDDLKFCSSMTLFAAISRDGSLYEQALQHFCHGRRDEKTLVLI